ncbi:NAD(P)H-dependent flavin oxidoreductase YrpB (nitropropane dioxygenase family) [Ilumatobacter fluminis]|uniref:NAD(P)H-dependent flavin oxidoreductase YrpB (Nitropropane dioxygenase family) n=1 Tax=Ilumatobacter fluminis TaxID=467091 RepID=A0A4R7I358_9ACTN|nr:nitronate monooxygenase family protein [Ilumatobacter fluminis]TDT16983.1 NAD(P)H-dependent flavin oxidoreductase YrpB (nitropropane dioxygenase family) [Ilumatobacter fluminis]
MKTAITEMFGVDVPILAFSHCRDVVAAVSKAGGMGVLGAVAHSDSQLEIDLAWIEDEIGDRPYGVDLIVPAKYAGDDAGGMDLADLVAMIPDEHRAFVDDILRRYEVPELPDDERSGRGLLGSDGAAPFSANRADPQLEIALAHRPALVVNALGPPPAHMIERVREEGRKVGALAGAAQHAERHVNAGVDVIIAQGSEAGGHTGEIGTMVLIPEIVDAVGDAAAVLGAGGIGRGRQMAAAMALGAQGVWCGSVWLTTDEAETHPAVKEKFLAATSADTVRSRSRTGKHARQLVTAWTEEWDRADTPDPLGMPLQPMLVDDAIRRIDRAAHHEGTGANRLANYFVGQVVGTMNESKPAARVVYEMIEEFIESVERLNTQLAD